jgi:hypothetical protein
MVQPRRQEGATLGPGVHSPSIGRGAPDWSRSAQMSRVESAGTVLLIGPGDLGARIALAVGRMPIGRLVVGARDLARAEAVAGQAALKASLLGGPRAVEACALDLDDADACAETLARIAPSVIVMAASRITWWRERPHRSTRRRCSHGSRWRTGRWTPRRSSGSSTRRIRCPPGGRRTT